MVERTHPIIIGGRQPRGKGGAGADDGTDGEADRSEAASRGNPPGVAEEIAAALAAEATYGSIRLPATIFLVTAAAALLSSDAGWNPAGSTMMGIRTKFAYVSAIGVFSSLLHDRG